MKRSKVTALLVTMVLMALVVAPVTASAAGPGRIVVWCMAAAGWEGWGEAGGLCSAVANDMEGCVRCCEDERACNNFIAAVGFLFFSIPLHYGPSPDGWTNSENNACVGNCITDVNDSGGGNNGSNGGGNGGSHGG